MSGGACKGHPGRPGLRAALEAALLHPTGLAMAREGTEGSCADLVQPSPEGWVGREESWGRGRALGWC